MSGAERTATEPLFLAISYSIEHARLGEVSVEGGGVARRGPHAGHMTGASQVERGRAGPHQASGTSHSGACTVGDTSEALKAINRGKVRTASIVVSPRLSLWRLDWPNKMTG